MVDESLCRARQRIHDERFVRAMDRFADVERMCDKLNRLRIEMSALVKKHDEQLSAQAQRLDSIERKPLRWWEKFAGATVTALGSAIGGGVLAIVLQGMVR